MRTWTALCALLCLARPLTGQGQLVLDSVTAPSLVGNRLGDPETRRLLVYLPPAYAADDGRRFPTVYLLHGFGGAPDSWTNGHYQGFELPRVLDSLFAAGANQFIVVMPDGHNRLGGSTFANSAATGDWETYLFRDVVRYVDGHYRTMRRGASRGIAGHSMGAAAALRIAMRFPGIFGVVYALSPNALLPCRVSPAEAETLLSLTRLEDAATVSGAAAICLGYSAAWSPDTTRPPFFAALPFRQEGGAILPDTAVLERQAGWQLVDMAPRYREGLVRLRAIGFDVGDQDPYFDGAARFDSLLTRLRVRHQFEHYPGDHSSGIADRLRQRVVPFFSEHLDFGPEVP